VPTTTRASRAIASIFPDMAERISGYAVRVPVPTVSILELTVQLGTPATANEINAAFERAAEGPLGQVLAVSDEPLVSTDFRGRRHAAIVDLPCTLTIGPLAKISAWYDNEHGYGMRVAAAAVALAERGLDGS
jgi:glyceraldehyde 3-phosphate dehydrogenase